MTLLDGARAMDAEALGVIFLEFAPSLSRYVLRTFRDPGMADQIVGDVFAKLMDQLARGRGPQVNLRSYLFESTYHLIIDELRSLRQKVSLEQIESLPREGDSVPLYLEQRVLAEALLQAIEHQLTAYQRQVIRLRFMEGYSLRETATILGKSVNIIKAAQNRAFVTLRQVLLCLMVV